MKYDVIISELKNDIIRGRYEPLTRLPTRNELAKRFSTTLATIQNAMNVLAKEGFTDSHGRDGTFVVENPPHLCKYGLCIPELPDNIYVWHRVWTLIVNEADRIRKEPSKNIQIYYGIRDDPKSIDREKLEDDIRERRLAGLIMFWPSKDLIEKLGNGEFPIVSFASILVPVPNHSAVWVDYYSMIDKMVAYLKKMNRKRIALVTNAETPRKYVDYFLKKIDTAGMSTQPYWIHGICLCKDSLPWSSSIFQLMLSGKKSQRPDGLVVLNENLTPYLYSAVSKIQLSIPDDIAIVSHCNFPVSGANDHIYRIGFDINIILKRCIAHIDKMRAGGREDSIDEIPAITQDDAR